MTLRFPVTVRGFTLVEVLISTTILALLMVLLMSTVDQTQRVWRRTTEKTVQFQAARAGFESMTRRLSQATLNVYWRAHDLDPSSRKANLRFRRQSELQFLSAPALRILGSSPEPAGLSQPLEKCYPTHAVFFQAPLGYTEEAQGNDVNVSRYRGLDSLLSACGYFVEFGPDLDRPAFLSGADSTVPLRYRFRLMELVVPTEHLTAYQRPVSATADLGFSDPRVFDRNQRYYVGMTMGADRRSNSSWVRPLWMEEAFLREPASVNALQRFSFAHVRAENIVALIVLPKLAEKDRVKPGTSTADPSQLELAPRYEFDSWRILSGGTTTDADGRTQLDNTARDNLLPPIVQVTMVAVDEASMGRIAPNENKVPAWTQGLFARVNTEADLRNDMQELERRLRADPAQLNYRIFSTDVVLRGSKWSRDPQ